MPTMPRPMPPYLYRERKRHGRIVFYVRRGKGPRIRVKGEFGSEDFARNYQSAILGVQPEQRSPVAPSGSLAWLIASYQDSATWDRLSAATKAQRGNIYKAIVKRADGALIRDITAKVIRQGVEDRAKTPFAANDFLKAMRAVFAWAKRAQHVESDPTEGVKGFPPAREGFHTWTDEEIAKFEKRWPIGTRERLAFAVLLYTGLRRGDACLLGRQHMREGIICLKTGKTGQQVSIPVLSELSRIIDATKTDDLALIAQPDGRPMTAGAFSNWFHRACKAAGVPGSAHGLRKAAATRMANAGFTESELDSWFGWKGGKMAALYTKNADRARLARRAVRKLK